MIAGHAFDRWIVRCMAAAGLPDLTRTDVMVFHHVYHRQRPKKLADICFTLNVEDTHIVSYALKKLERLGMVQGERASKEVFYSVTEEGSTVLKRYAEIREQCLTSGLNGGRRRTGVQPPARAYAARAVRPVRPGRSRGDFPLIPIANTARSPPPPAASAGIAAAAILFSGLPDHEVAILD